MDASARTSVEKFIQRPDSSSSTEESDESGWPKKRQYGTLSRRRWVVVCSFLSISVLINIVLAVVAYKAISGQKLVANPRWDEFTLPSPAETAISHKLVTFQNSINSDTMPYQGRPTKENNRLWEDLYSHEMTRISYEEALRLPNKTSPEAPYEVSGYLIVLNVFHNLHCLDSIRKALYYFVDPKWTAQNNPYMHMGDGGVDSMLRTTGKDLGITHVDHCIDALRQHQMCAVDITPNVFQYSPKDFGIRAMANVVHECRDFGKIKEWARDHRAPPFKGFGDGDAVDKCALNDHPSCLYK